MPLFLKELSNIFEFAQNKDSTELSKCNKKLRRSYEQQRKQKVHMITIKESESGKYNIETKHGSYPWNTITKKAMSLKKTRNYVHSVLPKRLYIQLSLQSMIKLLRKLRLQWLDDIETIHMEVQTATKDSRLEKSKVREIKQNVYYILEGFKQIDNLIFTSDQILTRRFDLARRCCSLLRWENYQNREFKITFEKMELRIEEIQHMIEILSFGREVHLMTEMGDSDYVNSLEALSLRLGGSSAGFQLNGTKFALMEDDHTKIREICKICYPILSSSIFVTLFASTDYITNISISALLSPPLALIMISPLLIVIYIEHIFINY